MFERFTREARTVVQRAYEEAAALGGDRMGPEHLLLALAGTAGPAARVLAPLGLDHETVRADLARAGGLDADALAAIGIDLDEVRRRVEESFGPGALGGRGRARRQRFTPKAKKALELALREAIALGDDHIGAEHILLGVMRDPGNRVAALLRRRGQSPGTVRAALLAAREPAT